MPITDFLQTTRSLTDLRVALGVLLEFKECESEDEYLDVAFAAWAKLEQLEEFLKHLANGEPLDKSTLEYLKHLEEKT